MPRRMIAVLSCAVLLAACADPAAEEKPAAGAPSPARSVQARWWEWAAAEPEETNPVADPSGENCARNQPDDVWFLAGTFGGEVRRRCRVPQGRPLVAPAINRVGGEASCRDYLTDVEGEVTFDGADVPLERREYEPVTFTAAEGNPVTGESGEIRDGACGLWARIDPPAAGEHRVRIHGRSGGFEVDVDYTLTVG